MSAQRIQTEQVHKIACRRAERGDGESMTRRDRYSSECECVCTCMQRDAASYRLIHCDVRHQDAVFIGSVQTLKSNTLTASLIRVRGHGRMSSYMLTSEGHALHQHAHHERVSNTVRRITVPCIAAKETTGRRTTPPTLYPECSTRVQDRSPRAFALTQR